MTLKKNELIHVVTNRSGLDGLDNDGFNKLVGTTILRNNTDDLTFTSPTTAIESYTINSGDYSVGDTISLQSLWTSPLINTKNYVINGQSIFIGNIQTDTIQTISIAVKSNTLQITDTLSSALTVIPINPATNNIRFRVDLISISGASSHIFSKYSITSKR